MIKLRPNLSNPVCIDELTNLNKFEKERIADFYFKIKEFREKNLDNQFE
jgi:hypothetical protein